MALSTGDAGQNAAPRGRPHQAEEILRLTRLMLEQAEAKEWEALSQTEEQRRPLIRQFFDKTVTAAEAKPVATFIREVLSIDKKTTEFAEAGKRELIERQRVVERGRKANRAYGR